MLELRGIILHGLADYMKAIEAIEKASNYLTRSGPARLAIADSYLQVGASELAKQQYKILANSRNLPYENLTDLAMGLGKLKEYELAKEVCLFAVELKGDCPQSRFGVAYYMAKIGYPPAFIYPILKKVIDMAPAVFYFRMAAVTILCKMNQLDRAYHTIADASPAELATIGCRCCLNRLISLYENASDHMRVTICRQRLAMAGRNCNGGL
ncbi:MAG: hypothetical protein NXI22_04070 [bacterium]|nr:hypothetical protein [bacterium]